MAKRDAQTQMEHELQRLLQSATAESKPFLENEMKRFASLFGRFLQEAGPSVDWSKIQKLPEEAVKNYATLVAPKDDKIRDMLDKLVVIKLNGGLGTSMGCHGPKSVIPVRSDLTFLDLTVQQIEVRHIFNNQIVINIITHLLIWWTEPEQNVQCQRAVGVDEFIQYRRGYGESDSKIQRFQSTNSHVQSELLSAHQPRLVVARPEGLRCGEGH